MKIATLALLVLYSGLASAQYSISGQVIDKNTKNGLIGANVTLKSAKTLVAATDNDGHFEFSGIENGEYILKVSYVGYEIYNQTINIPSDENLSIQLQEDPYLSDAVVVTATRANKNAPLSYSEIDKEELEVLNMGKDVPYLLEGMPSVVTTSDGGTGVGYTGIRIRGSDPTRVNVTLNGIPYNDSESQGVYWVDLPDIASSVESIQVQRGVGSSTNGAGAFGASINIQTTGLNKEAYATLDNAFGSFNTRKHTLSAGTGLINNAFTIDGRLSKIYTDGYLDRAFADLNSFYISAGYYGKSSLLKFNIFSGKEVTYQAWYGTPESRVKNDEQGMQDYIVRNGLNQDEAENLLNSGRTYNFYTYDNQVDDYKQTNYQLLFSHDFSDVFMINTALHYTHGEGFFEQYKADQNLSDYGFIGPKVGNILVDTTDLIRRRWLNNDFYGITFSGHYNPQEKLEIILGGAWNTYDGDHYGEVIWAEVTGNAKIRDRYYDNNGFKTDFNLYLKGSYNISGKLSLYGDIQYRKIDYSLKGIDNDRQVLSGNYRYQFFNPKVGLNYRLKTNTSFYASYSVGNKEPSRTDFVDSPGSEIPLPETLNDFELGFKKSDERLRLNANFYYMSYKNQLVLTGELNDVGSPLRTNVASSYRAGIELEFSYQLSKQLSVLANATFSKNMIQNFSEIIYDYGQNWDEYNEIIINYGTTNISFSPEIITGGTVNYQPINGLKLSWVHRFVGDQYLDNTTNEARKINSYYLSDFRANYSFSALKLKSISLNLAAYNLFNNFYEANGYTFGYRGGGMEVRENFFYPQAGINFMAGITLKL
jgi:iron complex outermembrane recepter protein